MRTTARRLPYALTPLLALTLWLVPPSGWTGRAATPEATPAAPCGAVATPAATPAATPSAAPISALTAADFALVSNAVTVRMTEDGFEPRAFQYAVGHQVEATLINTDRCEHTFTIDDLDIDVVIPPGETRHVTIPPAHYGDHPFHSRAAGDTGAQWTGLLRVYL